MVVCKMAQDLFVQFDEFYYLDTIRSIDGVRCPVYLTIEFRKTIKRKSKLKKEDNVEAIAIT